MEGDMKTLFIIILLLFIPSVLAADYPSGYADTVTLTADSIPYTIPQDELVILIDGTLTGDDNIITGSNRRDIIIAGANGDDTIMYNDDDTGDNEHGIQITQSQVIQIKDLAIINNNGALSTTTNCDGFYGWQLDSAFFSNIYVQYAGTDAVGIDIYSDGGSAIWIRTSTIKNECHSQSYRGDNRTAGLRIMGRDSLADYQLKCDSVNFLNMLHSAIYTNKASINSAYPKCYIYACSLFVDVRNKDHGGIWDEGDPMAMTFYCLGAGSEIHGNYISGIADTGQGGNGLLVQGAKGTAENPILFYDNEIHANFRKLTTGTGQYAIGLYMRWDEGGNYGSSQHVYFYNNEFYAYGNYTDYPRRVETIRIHRDKDQQFVKFHDNRIFALWEDSLSDHDRGNIWGIMIAKPDSTGGFAEDWFEYDDSTRLDSVAMSIAGDSIYDNYIYSHGAAIGCGSPAHYQLSFNNVTFIGDTLYCNYKGGSAADDSVTVMWPSNSSYANHGTGNQFINLVLLGDASESDITWDGFTSPIDTCDGKEVQWLRTVSIYVKDSLDNPVSGAAVTINNNNGQWSQGSTNASGYYYDTISYGYYWTNLEKKDCSIIDSVYNDYEFIAEYDGTADTSSGNTVTDSWDNAITLTLGTESAEVSHSVSTASVTHNSAIVIDDWSGVTGTVDSIWVWYDTDNDIAGADSVMETSGITQTIDSLALSGLAAETKYYIWFGLADDNGRDTAAIDSLTTVATPTGTKVIIMGIIQGWEHEENINFDGLHHHPDLFGIIGRFQNLSA